MKFQCLQIITSYEFQWLSKPLKFQKNWLFSFSCGENRNTPKIGNFLECPLIWFDILVRALVIASGQLSWFKKGQFMKFNDYGLSIRDIPKKLELLSLIMLFVNRLLKVWLDTIKQ